MSTSLSANSNKQSKNTTSQPVPIITKLKNHKNKSSSNIIHYIDDENPNFSIQTKSIMPIEDYISFSKPIPERILISNYQIQEEQQKHFHTHQQNIQLNNELSLSSSLIEKDIKEIRDYFRNTKKSEENADSKTSQTNEWKQLALVFDRVLFFVYIFSIIVSTTLLLK